MMEVEIVGDGGGERENPLVASLFTTDDAETKTLPAALVYSNKMTISQYKWIGILSFAVIVIVVAVVLAVTLSDKQDSCDSKMGLATDADKVAWLQANAINITTLTPDNYDDHFSDLQPLKDIMCEKEIVFLGEANHGDGTSESLRTRVVEMLHQECGFNTITFEIGVFDAYNAYSAVLNFDDAERNSPDAVREVFEFNVDVSPWWGHVDETQALFLYIASVSASKNPLEFVGYDYAGAGNFPHYYPFGSTTFFGGNALLAPKLVEFVRTATRSVNQNLMPDDQFFAMLSSITNQSYLLGVASLPDDANETETLINNFFSDLNANLDLLYGAIGHIDSSISNYRTWMQIYNTTLALARDQLVYGPPCHYYSGTCGDVEYVTNNRDSQMAATIRWWMDPVASESLVGITKRKMVVWTHNTHGAQNLQLLLDPNIQLPSICNYPKASPCLVSRAAGYLRPYFGDALYVVAATAFSGSTGSAVYPCNLTTPYKTFTAPLGSLEYYLRVAGFSVAAFVDLSGQAYATPLWLATANLTVSLMYNPFFAQLPTLFDGLFFIHTTNGVTCSPIRIPPSTEKNIQERYYS